MNLMRPKLLADIHISPLTVAEIWAIGYEIHRVSDFMIVSIEETEYRIRKLPIS